MVVHRIARRGDRWLESQRVVFHSSEEAGRSLAAPAELPDRDIELRHADCQIGLHDPRIHLLLGDRVAADGQPVPGLQQQALDRWCLERLVRGKVSIGGERFPLGRHQGRHGNQDDSE